MTQKILTIGEILMRLTTPNNSRFLQTSQYETCFGGAEANVALSLCNFGLDAAHITALPNNDIGKSCLHYMKSFGLDCSNFFFEEGRMGLYFLENGAMQRASKIIYDRFNSVFSNYDFSSLDFDAILKDITWLHYTGITPAISQNAADFTLKIVTAAHQKGITISGDINYRRNLWQYGKTPLEIMPKLIEKTSLVIGGSEDFKNSLGILEPDFETACKLMMEKYPNIKKVANTNREVRGSAHNILSGLLFDGKKILTTKSYEMEGIVDRIGGGDAFMAGLIYGLLHKNNADAVEFGVAASVLKHSILGDANSCTVDEVEQLVREENIGKLLR